MLADLIAFDTVSDRTNLPLIDYIEKYLTPFGITDMKPDHPIVTLAKQLSGRNSHSKVSFGTEASLFVAMAGIPTVVVGPGSIEQAHKPDEFVELSRNLRNAPASSSG